MGTVFRTPTVLEVAYLKTMHMDLNSEPFHKRRIFTEEYPGIGPLGVCTKFEFDSSTHLFILTIFNRAIAVVEYYMATN